MQLKTLLIGVVVMWIGIAYVIFHFVHKFW